MDNIEITVFDEINDYKEKIYFFNFRQWLFALLIIGLVVPTYLLLKDKIGEDITSYIVIGIAAILGFIGFVKIHELPAEKILPYWIRHYFLFAKPIHYISDNDFLLQSKKKSKKVKKSTTIEPKEKLSKTEIKELKKKQKQEKLLQKAKNKYNKNNSENEKVKTIENNNDKNNKESELSQRLSNLTKEQQEALLKLLER